jgi:hypothetical protein
VAPIELGPRFARVAEESIDPGSAKVTRVDFNEHLPRGAIDALLFDARPAPDYGSTDLVTNSRTEWLSQLASFC